MHEICGSIQEILNEVIRVLCANLLLDVDGLGRLQIFPSNEDIDFKIRLWGGFHQPLRPAVFVHAVPVVISRETG